MKFSPKCSDFFFLQSSYLTKRKLEVAPLKRALKDKDFDFIFFTFEHMIENASVYGFPEIEAIAKKVQSLISEKKYLDVESQLESFETFLATKQSISLQDKRSKQ